MKAQEATQEGWGLLRLFVLRSQEKFAMKRPSRPSRLFLEGFDKQIRSQVSARVEAQVEVGVWDETADWIASEIELNQIEPEIEWDGMEWIDHSFQV